MVLCFSGEFDMGQIRFEYIDGTFEEYAAERVTPYATPGLRTQNPSLDIIAGTLVERKAWQILSDSSEDEGRIINPHVVKSVSRRC